MAEQSVVPHTIELGGKERELRFKDKDRMALEALFPRPDGTPGGMYSLVVVHMASAGLGGSLLVQAAILWAGLRHGEKKGFSVDTVVGWLSDFFSEHPDTQEQIELLWNPLTYAIDESRVLGPHLRLRPVSEVDESEGKGEGKPGPRAVEAVRAHSSY